MNKKEIFNGIKEELKSLAIEIRGLKSQRKTYINPWTKTKTGWVKGLLVASDNFRYSHIAYCMLRFGRTMDEIEPKVQCDDPTCFTMIERHDYVKRYLNEYETRLSCAEVIHNS